MEEKKIDALMKTKDNNVLVSICCIAFNHEQFIRKALDGFMMQKTNFAFEVLINDDASTDNTAEIIREYELKYPDIIKPIYQTENQWRKGIRGSSVHNFPRAVGKYIALCEGDDYWTDSTKLQRQIDFLESHEDYSLVTENALVLNTEKNTQYDFNDFEECDIDIYQLLGKRTFPTASAVFRSKYITAEFHQLKYKGDVIMWCYLAGKGKIRYFPTISSVYSRGLHGMVLSSRNIEWARMLESWNEVLSGILPESVDRSILNQRNFNEYQKVFRLSVKKNDTKVARQALKKCFKFQPLSTVKMLIKFYAKKVTPAKTASFST
jgi:glycosyltransferase involved in cell wall biosynthesis